jgi:hypothetical protein
MTLVHVEPLWMLRVLFHLTGLIAVRKVLIEVRRVQVHQADVVLILADRRTENPDEEDAANIMRATAIKNLSSDIRIIIQLLQHQNKVSSSVR